MKHNVYPECWLFGENFLPKELEKKFPEIAFKEMRTKGEIGTRGRWKGKELPHSSCMIFTPDEIEKDRVIFLCDFLIENKNILLESGVSEPEMRIWLNWFGIQGNMELNRFEIKKLSETGLDMAMNYIFSESNT